MLTLLRNNECLNKAFMLTPKGVKSYVFNEVCRTEKNLIFDEWGFQIILGTIPGIRMMDTYKDSFERFCDILPPNGINQLKRRFYDEPFYLSYINGRVILNSVKSGIWQEREYAMCHLQKRKMIPQVDLNGDFIIHENELLPLKDNSYIQQRLELIRPENRVNTLKQKTVKKQYINRFFELIKESPVSTFLRIIRIIREKIL